jgi:hypothetical protein
MLLRLVSYQRLRAGCTAIGEPAASRIEEGSPENHLDTRYMGIPSSTSGQFVECDRVNDRAARSPVRMGSSIVPRRQGDSGCGGLYSRPKELHTRAVELVDVGYATSHAHDQGQG